MDFAAKLHGIELYLTACFGYFSTLPNVSVFPLAAQEEEDRNVSEEPNEVRSPRVVSPRKQSIYRSYHIMLFLVCAQREEDNDAQPADEAEHVEAAAQQQQETREDMVAHMNFDMSLPGAHSYCEPPFLHHFST